jgi:hypothetical protein
LHKVLCIIYLHKWYQPGGLIPNITYQPILQTYSVVVSVTSRSRLSADWSRRTWVGGIYRLSMQQLFSMKWFYTDDVDLAWNNFIPIMCIQHEMILYKQCGFSMSRFYTNSVHLAWNDFIPIIGNKVPNDFFPKLTSFNVHSNKY